jgi:hypothetical protein
MKIKNYIIIGLVGLLIFSYTICFADDDNGFTDKKDIQNFCEIVVINLKDEKVIDAFNLMAGKSLIPVSELAALQVSTSKQLDLVKSRFGNILDYKLIKQDEIEGLAIKYTYIIKYEKHIIRWIFIFYKPKDKWYLDSLNWDDKLIELFNK